MGISMKKFSRMKPEQWAKYRHNVTRLYRSQLLAHAVGLGGVCLVGSCLLAYHLVN